METKVRPLLLRGVIRWRVDHIDPQTGKRRQPSFANKTDAERAARQLEAGVKVVRKSWRRLSAGEQSELSIAYRIARQNGHSLSDLLSQAKTRDPEGNGPKLIVVIRELTEAKDSSGRSDVYVKSLGNVLVDFATGLEHRPINRVTVEDVQRFLDAKTLASRSTFRARLSTLFKFAIRRRYRRDNPCEQLESVTYLKPRPQVFTVEQFTDAWNWLKATATDGLGWFVLSTCCGLRPEEAEKTTKEDINFTEGFVRVEAQTTKVRQRRVVYPRAEAMALLHKAKDLGARFPITPARRQLIIQGRDDDGLRNALGFKAWPKDITRHTAATYLLADGQTAGDVAESLGNSAQILNRDYKALKTRKEAVEFWQTVEQLATGKNHENNISSNLRAGHAAGRLRHHSNTPRQPFKV